MAIRGRGGREHATPDGSYAPRQCAVAEHAIDSNPWLMPSGSFPDCRTPEGVYDLMGNLWEWTDPQRQDEQGRPLTDKRGGAHYSQGPVGCGFDALGLHPPEFTGSIGFRCCVVPG